MHRAANRRPKLRSGPAGGSCSPPPCGGRGVAFIFASSLRPPAGGQRIGTIRGMNSRGESRRWSEDRRIDGNSSACRRRVRCSSPWPTRRVGRWPTRPQAKNDRPRPGPDRLRRPGLVGRPRRVELRRLPGRLRRRQGPRREGEGRASHRQGQGRRLRGLPQGPRAARTSTPSSSARPTTGTPRS